MVVADGAFSKTGNIIPTLKEYYVAKAKLKSTEEEAFVIAGNGEIIFDCTDYEVMCYECDKIKLLAQMGEEKKYETDFR